MLALVARHPLRSFLTCITAITLLRLIELYFSPYGLYADEAQYWFWAQTPDWGYYSKPPMVAWAIALTTQLCGSDSVFCTKLASPLIYAVTSGFIYAIARMLFDTRTAFWSGLLFLTIPGVSLSAMIISTDPFLLLFWSMALWSLLHAERDNHWSAWLLLGLSAGLGLLSKYNFAFLLPTIVLLSWWRNDNYTLLRRPGLYAAGILGIAMILPNVAWNAAHDWASFRHTGDISQLEAQSWFHPFELLEFIGAQAALLGPILFVFTLLAALRTKELPDNASYQPLWAFILPLLTAILLLSFLTRAHGNWAAPIHVTATLIAVAYACQRDWMRWLIATLALQLILSLGIMHFDTIARVTHLQLTRKNDPFYRVRGWEEAGAQLTAMAAHYPQATLLTDRRKITALLHYYVQPHGREIIQWNQYGGLVKDHFLLTSSMKGRDGLSFLIVVPPPHVPNEILSHFESSEMVGEIRTPLHSETDTLSLDVYYARGFKGL